MLKEHLESKSIYNTDGYWGRLPCSVITGWPTTPIVMLLWWAMFTKPFYLTTLMLRQAVVGKILWGIPSKQRTRTWVYHGCYVDLLHLPAWMMNGGQQLAEKVFQHTTSSSLEMCSGCSANFCLMSWRCRVGESHRVIMHTEHRCPRGAHVIVIGSPYKFIVLQTQTEQDTLITAEVAFAIRRPIPNKQLEH